MKKYYVLEDDKNLRNKGVSTAALKELFEKVGETPIMNERTVFPQILESHMTPKGKWGRVVVISGSIDYKWHDDEDIYIIDRKNPLIIEPERLHNLILDGAVEFKVEFYKENKATEYEYSNNVLRPGEAFL